MDFSTAGYGAGSIGIPYNSLITIVSLSPSGGDDTAGCIGKQVTTAAPGTATTALQGPIDSSGVYVFPTSLYQTQLTQRVPGAVAQ